MVKGIEKLNMDIKILEAQRLLELLNFNLIFLSFLKGLFQDMVKKYF